MPFFNIGEMSAENNCQLSTVNFPRVATRRRGMKASVATTGGLSPQRSCDLSLLNARILGSVSYVRFQPSWRIVCTACTW